MHQELDYRKAITRRQFFGQSAVGIGATALAGLLGRDSQAEATALLPHIAPKAKHVIYLFMSGGPSHLDLFDYKPMLTKLDGQPVPESMMEQQRFAFIKGVPNIGAPRWSFKQYGQSGVSMSELLPHTASIADDIAVVHSMHTEQFNHDPAVMFMNSGSPLQGRPSMGAWASYGLAARCKSLPV